MQDASPPRSAYARGLAIAGPLARAKTGGEAPLADRRQEARMARRIEGRQRQALPYFARVPRLDAAGEIVSEPVLVVGIGARRAEVSLGRPPGLGAPAAPGAARGLRDVGGRLRRLRRARAHGPARTAAAGRPGREAPRVATRARVPARPAPSRGSRRRPPRRVPRRRFARLRACYGRLSGPVSAARAARDEPPSRSRPRQRPITATSVRAVRRPVRSEAPRQPALQLVPCRSEAARVPRSRSPT